MSIYVSDIKIDTLKNNISTQISQPAYSSLINGTDKQLFFQHKNGVKDFILNVAELIKNDNDRVDKERLVKELVASIPDNFNQAHGNMLCDIIKPLLIYRKQVFNVPNEDELQKELKDDIEKYISTIMDKTLQKSFVEKQIQKNPIQVEGSEEKNVLKIAPLIPNNSNKIVKKLLKPVPKGNITINKLEKALEQVLASEDNEIITIVSELVKLPLNKLSGEPSISKEFSVPKDVYIKALQDLIDNDFLHLSEDRSINKNILKKLDEVKKELGITTEKEAVRTI